MLSKEAVVSDLLRKTRTEWWQHYQNGEGQDDLARTSESTLNVEPH